MSQAVCYSKTRTYYTSFEMAEERIAERIDNLLNVPIGDIVDLPKQMFESKVTNLVRRHKEHRSSKSIRRLPLMLDILDHFFRNLHLRSHLDLILFSLITLIYVFPLGYRRK